MKKIPERSDLVKVKSRPLPLILALKWKFWVAILISITILWLNLFKILASDITPSLLLYPVLRLVSWSFPVLKLSSWSESIGYASVRWWRLSCWSKDGTVRLCIPSPVLQCAEELRCALSELECLKGQNMELGKGKLGKMKRFQELNQLLDELSRRDGILNESRYLIVVHRKAYGIPLWCKGMEHHTK